MTEIRKDVLGQLESLIRAAGDLARLYQERKDDGRDESYLRRRVAVYQGFYSLIYNLSVRRDDLIERDLAAFEEILAREAPAFANLFVPDLGYFLDNLGENQELPRREYVRRLIRCCPQQALRCRAILAEHLAAQ